MILHHPKTRPLPWSEISSKVKPWGIPFHALEHLFNWATYLLSNWAFLETLEYLSSLSVLIAVIFYFSESDARMRQRHYQAWQVINTAQGKGGSGGRIEALEELAKDKVSLTGVDVSMAFLRGVDLKGANLVRANFHNSDVRRSSLSSTDLSDAILSGANFRDSDFRDSALRGTQLDDVELVRANLANADLSGATLDNADLRSTDLRNIKWQSISSIKSADVFGVKNAPAGFVDWAMQHGAIQSGKGPE
jgi:hypothetical protein